MGLQGSRVQIPPSRLGGAVLWSAPSHSPESTCPSRSLPLYRLTIAGIATCLLACGGSADRTASSAKGGFSPVLEVDTTTMTKTPSGLRYQDVTVGQGKAATPGQ